LADRLRGVFIKLCASGPMALRLRILNFCARGRVDFGAQTVRISPVPRRGVKRVDHAIFDRMEGHNSSWPRALTRVRRINR